MKTIEYPSCKMSEKNVKDLTLNLVSKRERNCTQRELQ